MAADYGKYSAPDFDAHSELMSVQHEIAALRDELDVRSHAMVQSLLLRASINRSANFMSSKSHRLISRSVSRTAATFPGLVVPTANTAAMTSRVDLPLYLSLVHVLSLTWDVSIEIPRCEQI